MARIGLLWPALAHHEQDYRRAAQAGAAAQNAANEAKGNGCHTLSLEPPRNPISSSAKAMTTAAMSTRSTDWSM